MSLYFLKKKKKDTKMQPRQWMSLKYKNTGPYYKAVAQNRDYFAYGSVNCVKPILHNSMPYVYVEIEIVIVLLSESLLPHQYKKIKNTYHWTRVCVRMKIYDIIQ